MNLYDNGCYMWDSLCLGMARALVEEAERLYQEEDNHLYDDIVDMVDENCIDTLVVDLLVITARNYCRAGLLHNTTDKYMMDEGYDLFNDLYFGNNHHLLQDNDNANAFYDKYQKIFERTPSISESVDGDIRVFFE